MKMLISQWKEILHKRSLMLAVIGILFVPLLYGGLFLSAFWNPYGHTNHLKIAVINQDGGAVIDGKTVTLGQSLVSRLKKNPRFDWQFLRPSEKKAAVESLERGDYYMIITIPPNFSESAATLLDAQPKQVKLNYAVNSGKSYTAAQMVKGAIPKINHKIAKEVTRNYAVTLFDLLKKMETGLKTAASGTEKAQKDAHDLANGANTLDKGMKQLASSSLLFKNGLSQASAGAEKISIHLNALHTGGQTLDNGLAELKRNQDKLYGGITDAAAGGQELDKKMRQLNGGEQTFNKRINSVISLLKEAGNDAGPADEDSIGTWAKLFGQLNQQLDDIQTVQQSLIDSTKSTLANIQSIQDSEHKKIQDYVAANPYLSPTEKKNIGSGLQTIQDQSDQSMEQQKEKLEAKLDKSQQQLDDLKKTQDNLGRLSAGTQAMLDRQTQIMLAAAGLRVSNDNNIDTTAYGTKVRRALSRFQENSNQIAKGTAALAKATGQMAAGLQTLQDGGKKIKQGTDRLKTGSSALRTGTGQLSAAGDHLAGGLGHLSAGGGALDSGADKLADSSGRLNNGTDQLRNGIGRFHQRLQDQTNPLAAIHIGQPQADRFAEPTNTTVSDAHYVHNYGEGLAPYIISLGLFVGALTFSIFFPMRQTDLAPTSGLAWFFSKYSVAASVAVLQAVFICTILLEGLGLEVVSVWRFYLFAIMTSLCFFALVQWLTTAFGNGGRMICGLLLLIQFGGSSGAFPVVLTPAFYQWVHAFLPMTYSVKGLRQVISIGIDDGYLGIQSFILICIAIASMILTWVTFIFLRKRSIKGKLNSSADDNLPING